MAMIIGGQTLEFSSPMSRTLGIRHSNNGKERGGGEAIERLRAPKRKFGLEFHKVLDENNPQNVIKVMDKDSRTCCTRRRLRRFPEVWPNLIMVRLSLYN